MKKWICTLALAVSGLPYVSGDVIRAAAPCPNPNANAIVRDVSTPATVGGATPVLGLTKRYCPYPDPDDRAMPRMAMLDIHIPADAILYVDGQRAQTRNGCYHYDSQLPLIPGVAYIHAVRVERIANGKVLGAREVDVYLRMGRLTELTFN